MSDVSSFFSAYSESFRGLPDGWHTLKKVNFLVGENSTGKSSFIQLLTLLSSQQFIFSCQATGVVPSISSAHDFISRIRSAEFASIGFASYVRGRDGGEEGNFFGRIVTYYDVKDSLEVYAVTAVASGIGFTIYAEDKDVMLAKHDLPSVAELARNPSILEILHRSAVTDRKGEILHSGDEDGENHEWRVLLMQACQRFEEMGMGAFLIPKPLNTLSYGPMRRAPQRLMHGDSLRFNSTGTHAPFVFRKFLQHVPELEKRLQRFGISSRLFDSVSIEEIATKAGDTPFVFTLQRGEKSFYIDELGFGVSQILPVVVDMLVSNDANTLLIQQPELHLHPRAQAEFGSFTHESCQEGPRVVIETHSDFVIDRFRVEQAEAASEKKIPAQVMFFDQGDNPANGILHYMDILGDGSFSVCPDSYRDFFVHENMKILEAL